MRATVPVLCLLIVFHMVDGDMNDILANINLPDVKLSENLLHPRSDPDDSKKKPSITTLRVSCLQQEPFTGIDLSTGRFKGLEIDLIQTVAQHMGLKAVFELCANQSLHLKQLTDKSTADILIGGLFLSAVNANNISVMTSIPYVFDDMTWCVATAKERPKWMNIFCIFPAWMWVVLVSIGYLNSFLIYVKMQFEAPRNRWDYHRICMMMLCSNLAMSNKGLQPKRPGLTLFYLYMVFYGILLIATFNSFLIKNLTKPIRWDQVDTVDKILAEQMQVVGDPKAFVLFDNGQKNVISAYVRQHFWPCPDIDICLGHLAERGDLAVAVSRLHSRNNRRLHPSQMYCFPQAEGNIINYPVRMLMRSGDSHLVERINDIVRRAFEAGLIQKWSRDNERSIVPEIGPDNAVMLTMEHLAGAWAAMILFIPLGLMTLVAELLAWRRLQSAEPGRGRRLAKWGERVVLRDGRSYF